MQLINDDLLDVLRVKAREGERLRQNFDLRNSPEDTSQRMLNVLEVGTQVPIHRHEDTSETVICLKGKLDGIFYEEISQEDVDEAGCRFRERFRFSLCPAEGNYGVQIPKGTWHTVEVQEPSVIFEAKDGRYEG